MRKHILVLTAVALVITATVAAATTQFPVQGAGPAAAISPEELHRQVDGRSVPLTYIEDAY